MRSDFYVYAHTRNDTGAIFYVGKGRGDRACLKKGRSEHWRRIEQKHGRTVLMLAEGLDEELAFLVEQEAIDKLRMIGVQLVNMTDGGEGARLAPEHEAKRIASIAKYHRENKSALQDCLKRAIASDPKLLERRAESIRAAYKRDEVREKIRANARTEFALSRHKEAMQRDSVKQKLRDSAAKPVLCVETGEVFPMVMAAVAWLRCNGKPFAQGGHISQVCLGKHKSAYGYTWRHASRGK